MTSYLFPSFHSSYEYLLHRLESLDCPHIQRLRGDDNQPAFDLFDSALIHQAHAVLTQQDDAAVHASPCNQLLVLRLSLVTWILDRYDPDLLRVCHDLPEDYTHKTRNQTVLFQFKRVLHVCTFIGAIPPACTAPLTILTGTASFAFQLQFLHTLVDLVQSLPKDPFYASHTMYSSSNSYQVHNDVEFHKRIRLLHCITNTASTSVPEENIMSERIDLFPPTLMMTANSNKYVKQMGKGIPDPLQLNLQLERLQQELASKALVLKDLQARLPLTTNENYLPSLTHFESHLSTFVSLVLRFSEGFQEKFFPLIQPLLSSSGAQLNLSPLGSQLAQLGKEKQALDSMLLACGEIKKNYESLIQSNIRQEMDRLAAAKPDDRVTAKLSELRKVFEQSLLRLEKEGQQREQKAKEIVQAAQAASIQAEKEKNITSLAIERVMRDGQLASQPPPPSASKSLAASTSTTTSFSRSILTSSIDLTQSQEKVGSGSAGLFSPLKPGPLPHTLVTRTGAVDMAAMERIRQKEEQDRRHQLELEEIRQSNAKRIESIVQSTPIQPRSSLLAPYTPTYVTPHQMR